MRKKSARVLLAAKNIQAPMRLRVIPRIGYGGGGGALEAIKIPVINGSTKNRNGKAMVQGFSVDFRQNDFGTLNNQGAYG